MISAWVIWPWDVGTAGSFAVAFALALPFFAIWLWRLRSRWGGVSALRRVLAAAAITVGWSALAAAIWIMFLGVPVAQTRKARLRAATDARQVLKAVYRAQKDWQQETDHYRTTFADLGLQTTPEQLFTVAMGQERLGADSVEGVCQLTGSWPDGTRVESTGVRGEDWVAAAVLPRGRDTFCWSIASFDRTGPGGERIPAGEPHDEAPLTGP